MDQFPNWIGLIKTFIWIFCMNLFDSYQAVSPAICSTIKPEKGSINSPVQIENWVLVSTLEPIVLAVFSPSGIELSTLSSLWCPAAKKPSDAAPTAAKKPPAPKAKKPDKSIWDSDSDTASKNPAPALKGTQQNRCFSHLCPRWTGIISARREHFSQLLSVLRR